MWVSFTFELKASPGFSDQLNAAEQELKSIFATVRRTGENAPSVGVIAKGTCRGERAISLIEGMAGFSDRHPEILVFVAYEMDEMYDPGGYLVFHGGQKLVDESADCEHLLGNVIDSQELRDILDRVGPPPASTPGF